MEWFESQTANVTPKASQPRKVRGTYLDRCGTRAEMVYALLKAHQVDGGISASLGPAWDPSSLLCSLKACEPGRQPCQQTEVDHPQRE